MINLIKKLASWPLPLVAAFAKALGNSYGALLLYSFLITGTLTITASLLNPGIWFLLGCFAFSVFSVSIFMEGKALAKQIAKWLGFKPKKPYSLKTHYPNLYSFLATFFSMLGYFLSPFTYVLSYLVPFLASLAKGATMTAGTIGTLTLIFTTVGLVANPTSWIIAIAILFGLGVMGASLCKEGFTFKRKFFQYCLPEKNLLSPLLEVFDKSLKQPFEKFLKTITTPIGNWQRRTPWINKPLRLITQIISMLFPMAAALGKSLGNGFGVINFLNMYGHLPQMVGNLTPELPILITYLVLLSVVGIAITIDSFTMEGYHLWHYLYKSINSFIGVQSKKENLQFKFAFNSNKIAQKISKHYGMDPNDYAISPSLTVHFLSFTAWIPSVIAGLAKGCTMGTGMAGILMLALGLPALTSPLGMVVAGTALFCGFTVALVSIFKEGRTLHRRLSTLLLKYLEHKDEATYGSQYKKWFTHDYMELLNKVNEEEASAVDIDYLTKEYAKDPSKGFPNHVSKLKPYTASSLNNKEDEDEEEDPFYGVPSCLNYGVN